MARPVKMFRSANSSPEHLPEKTMFGKRMEEWAFNWTGVDGRLLTCAMAQVAQMDCALLFAAAAGGRGVAVKVYQGKLPKTVVVLTPEELHELLEELIDHFGSPSEDVRMAWGLANGSTLAGVTPEA